MTDSMPNPRQEENPSAEHASLDKTAGGERHPLEPLSAEELSHAAGLLRSDSRISRDLLFVSLELKEPQRQADLLDAPERAAEAVVYDLERRLVCEAVISLSRDTVDRLRFVPGAHPPVLVDEIPAIQGEIRSDVRWQSAMRRRGLTNYDAILIEPWPVGGFAWRHDRRLLLAYSFVRPQPDDNPYARPVEGVIVRIALDPLEIVEVEDHGVVPIPERDGNYSPDRLASPNWPAFAGTRSDQRPIDITQPDGPSFIVEGHHVSWQRWTVRIGFTAREGLVLHELSYNDRGTTRPVLQRASMAEMIVPYGDPRPTHYRRNVFDMGEAGLGRLANSLTLGCDCLGEIRYFDAHLVDGEGIPLHIPNAICMHEEDAGIAWKHTDTATGHVEVRRMRRLVLSSISTVDNYEYGFYWYLYQDGTIELEVKLTGIILTGAARGDEDGYGVPVAPGLYGPNHQHHFCVRLDMAVAGLENTVEEVNSTLVPDTEPDGENGSAWRFERTVLRTERTARRCINPASARHWRIINRRTPKRSPTSRCPGYRLEPGESTPLLQRPDSPNGRRALFASSNLWVTRYHPEERFAAGDYPNQHSGGAGLPAYVADDEPLEDEDLVVWYSFGAHHIVRPEDWPVMPVTRIGFRLRPDGFFDGNPALDLPPATECGDTAGRGCG